MFDCSTRHVILAHKFTGKERDTETFLDYFGARYLGSNQGRFMSTDPYNPIIIRQGMKAGGLPEVAADDFFTAFLEVPQNWNKYSYGLNNPLRFVDPSGAAPQDGHHLIPERGGLGPIGQDFANSIKTGALSGNGRPNQPGFNELHRAYNNAVRDMLNQAVQEEGPTEEWSVASVAQWQDFANKVLKSDEPAIKNFLEELEENNPGAKAALAAAIASYRVTASVLARIIVSVLFRRALSVRTLILCLTCDRYRANEHVWWRMVPPA